MMRGITSFSQRLSSSVHVLMASASDMKGARYGHTAMNFHSNSSKRRSLIIDEMSVERYSPKIWKVASVTGAAGTVEQTVSRSAAKHTSGSIDLAASSLSIDSWMFLSVLSALTHTLRASGSDISSPRRLISGISEGRKGLASRGWSMSFDMLSTITATLRLISVFFSWQPRRRMGTVIASAGESTDCTNTVDDSACTVSPTSSGFWMALTSGPTKGLMSRLVTELQATSMHAAAASFTSFFVSHMASDMGAIAVGRQREKGMGCFPASFLRRLHTSTLTCHLVDLSALKSRSSTGRTDHEHTLSIRLCAASSATIWTSFFLCATSSQMVWIIGTRNGSTMVLHSAESAEIRV
mmetsp:Transcript_51439/g.122486  ORF Transcript_51439/g.122486 Transcript_51439/m.122486 type:complete len:353 (+) Transcript_51439:1608-2666(+)